MVKMKKIICKLKGHSPIVTIDLLPKVKCSRCGEFGFMEYPYKFSSKEVKFKIDKCPIHIGNSTPRCPDCRADDLYLLGDVIAHGLSLKKEEFEKQMNAKLDFYKREALSFYKKNKWLK